MRNLLEEIALADEVGPCSLGIGEHLRADSYASAPAIVLAAAARTNRIRPGSAVAVLSAVDPGHRFRQSANLDPIFNGRIDLVVGRGSFADV